MSHGSAMFGQHMSQDQTPPPSDTPPPTKSRRGFASMTRERVAEIAAKGGKAAHAAGRAHEFTSDKAREAGRKGGAAAHAKRRDTPLALENPILDEGDGDNE